MLLKILSIVLYVILTFVLLIASEDGIDNLFFKFTGRYDEDKIAFLFFGIVSITARIKWFGFWHSLLLGTGVYLFVLILEIIFYRSKYKRIESEKRKKEQQRLSMYLDDINNINSIQGCDDCLSFFNKEESRNTSLLGEVGVVFFYKYKNNSLNRDEYEFLINAIKERRQQLINELNQRDIEQENASKNIKNLLEDIRYE